LCKHGDRMAYREVKKEGPNRGRRFLTCGNPKESCNAFLWEEEVVGLAGMLKKEQQKTGESSKSNLERSNVVFPGSDDNEAERIKRESRALHSVKSWQEKLRKEVQFPFIAYIVADSKTKNLISPIEVTVEGFTPSFGEGVEKDCVMLCDAHNNKGRVPIPLSCLSVRVQPKGFAWLNAYPY